MFKSWGIGMVLLVCLSQCLHVLQCSHSHQVWHKVKVGVSFTRMLVHGCLTSRHPFWLIYIYNLNGQMQLVRWVITFISYCPHDWAVMSWSGKMWLWSSQNSQNGLNNCKQLYQTCNYDNSWDKCLLFSLIYCTTWALLAFLCSGWNKCRLSVSNMIFSSQHSI